MDGKGTEIGCDSQDCMCVRAYAGGTGKGVTEEHIAMCFPGRTRALQPSYFAP